MLRRSRLGLAGAGTAVMLLVSGCGFTGIYDLPLPGGADLGDHPYTVKIELRDALDLVPQAGVKINEVPVGRVQDIALGKDGWTAEVTLLINGDRQLPANALASLRQSSLLGEKYVELAAPEHPEGRLADGAVIGLDRTTRDTEVEEVLGALSMLLNGGGIDQLRTITQELNKTLGGNEPQLRATLQNVNTLVTGLDAHRNDITRAIEGLNRLSVTLNGQRSQLTTALDGLGPGLQVLADQRGELVTMLTSLRSLSDTAVDTLHRSQGDIIADLKALQPTLQKLSDAGANLPKSLEYMFTFPFTDSAVPGIKGDYANLYLNIDLNLQTVIDNYGRSRTSPLDGLPVVGGAGRGQTGPSPNYTPLPLPGDVQVPGVPGLSGGLGGGGGYGSIFNTLTGGGA